jgi:hypothetical protein
VAADALIQMENHCDLRSEFHCSPPSSYSSFLRLDDDYPAAVVIPVFRFLYTVKGPAQFFLPTGNTRDQVLRVSSHMHRARGLTSFGKRTKKRV